ncbi:MAG TPA: exodeoxyribonuclease III [Trueperaceae bacterium]
MRIVSLNVNGLRSAARRGLAEVLEEVSADVVCLQEVRASPEQAAGLVGNAYHESWNPAARAGYSGVGTLTRSRPRRVEAGSGRSEFDVEGRVLVSDVGGLLLLNVYVPSGTMGQARQAVKMSFLDHFLPFVSGLVAAGRPLVLCGDMNIAHRQIDLKNWRANQRTSGFLPEEREWFSRLLGAGLVDVVRRLAGEETEVYTWWTLRAGARERNVGWRLDYQLATPDVAERATAFEVRRSPMLSDHAPVIVDYDL